MLLQMLAAAAADAPDAPKTFADGYMTFPALVTTIAAILAIVGSCVAIIRAVRTSRREGEADVRAQVDPVKGDVRAIQTTIAEFMPRPEIEYRDREVRSIAEGAARDVADLREKYGRLDERQQGLADDVGEVKTLIKENGRDVTGRLDRLQECLIEISRKVG